MTLPTYIWSQQSIEAAALKLLAKELPIEIRLMGIRVSAFRSCPTTPSQPKLEALLAPRPDGGGGVVGPEGGAERGDSAQLGDARGVDPETAACAHDSGAACAGASEGPMEQVSPSSGQGAQEPAATSRCAARPVRAGVPTASDGLAWVVHNAYPSSGTCAADASAQLPRSAGALPDALPQAGDCSLNPAPIGAAAVVCSGQAHDANEGDVHTLERSTASVDAVVCSECGAQIARAGEQEHMDWHVAQRLSAAVNGPGYISGASRCSTGAERRSEVPQRPEKGRSRPARSESGGRTAGGAKRQRPADVRPAASQLLKYFGPKA